MVARLCLVFHLASAEFAFSDSNSATRHEMDSVEKGFQKNIFKPSELQSERVAAICMQMEIINPFMSLMRNDPY